MTRQELAGLLMGLAEATGASFTPSSFERRLRIQKTIYLLKALGHPLAHKYRFGAYFHGPYSAGLAKDYYALAGARTATRSPAANLPENQVEVVREAVRRGNDFLEAAASLHSLARANPQLPKEGIVAHARSIKPRLSDLFQEAWTFLEEHRLVGSPT